MMHYKTPFIKSTSRIHFVGKNFIYRSIMSLVSLNPGFLLAKIQQNFKLTLVQFNLKTIHNNTMNFRSVDSFYQLSSLLKSHHPWLSVPPLPLRPSFWISSVRQVFLVELKMLTIRFHDTNMVGYDIIVLMRPVR